ncbi:hypothetical protein P6F26_16800 [Roseibacterium sp. SDUM158017]|uniref:hypothetical protein n=1 Tax=Roseicyclus salinarum TaxID=3036773 RepID=UPI002414FAD0|nr:hypothetical protein [Roseibacterium sp. SDUM158017]MDG4650109.1 hypothetical protein [Roseibacterium sp. SDUM158017]
MESPLIPTVEIVVDGRRKIVNADDPRAKEASNAKGQGIRQENRPQEVKPRRGRPRKKAD